MFNILSSYHPGNTSLSWFFLIVQSPLGGTYVVSVKVSIAVMKHRGQKQLGRKQLTWDAYPDSQSIEGHQGRNSKWAGTWRQELMQEPWRDAAYCLVPHDLLSLLSYRTQNQQPRDGTTHHGLGLSPLITNFKNALQLDLTEAFPQPRLLLL